MTRENWNDPKGQETSFAMRDGNHATPRAACQPPILRHSGHSHRDLQQTAHATRYQYVCDSRVGKGRHEKTLFRAATHLALGTLTSGLDTVATLDHIGLQAYRTRSAMEFEKETTGIAQNRTEFVPTPKRRGGGAAILADRLQLRSLLVSQCGRHEEQEERGREKRVGGEEERCWGG